MMPMTLPHYLVDPDKSFSGWNFSYLKSTSRMHEAPLPWNYYIHAIKYFYYAHAVLDLGTGGGEFLSQFPLQNKKVYATERYEPNIAIAKQNLEPFGVQVMGLEMDAKIPLESNSLDLILSRHEAYKEEEVYTLLNQYGVFITQQVGGDNNKELYSMLGCKQNYPTLHLKQVKAKLKDAGFYIGYHREAKTFTRFYDIGAVLFYLNALSHQFNITDGYMYDVGIRQIDNIIEQNGYFDVTCHRLIVVAQKSEEAFTKFIIKEHDID